MASRAKLQYLDEQQRCNHVHRSKPAGFHPILSRPNKRSNLLSSLLPCLASSMIMKPFEERFYPGLQVIKQRGDKRTPRHRFTVLLKTKMDARGNSTSVRLRDITVFADLRPADCGTRRIDQNCSVLVSFTYFSFGHSRIFFW